MGQSKGCFFPLPYQYAGCVFLRFCCVFLLWMALLVEGHGPPCVKIGNASWAFFSSLPWTKKEILCTPLQREAKCQPHYFPFFFFFLIKEGSFSFSQLTSCKMYFWNGSCVFTPVFCSLLMELHVLSYMSPLLIWKSAVTFYLLLRFSKALRQVTNTCLSETVSRGWLRGERCAGLGLIPCSVLCHVVL